RIARRQREQQLFGALTPLLCPETHRNRGNEKHQQVRKEAIELIEIRQIVSEKAILPERRHCAQKDKERNEDVAGRRAEVARQLAAHDRADYVAAGAHPSPSVKNSNASSSVACSPCISRGVPSKTIRPRLIRITRSATASTSCRMCVERRIVRFAAISRMVRRTSRIWLGSSPLVGSSMISTSGSCSSTWAIPTRCL